MKAQHSQSCVKIFNSKGGLQPPLRMAHEVTNETNITCQNPTLINLSNKIIPTIQFRTRIPKNAQSKPDLLSLAEYDRNPNVMHCGILLAYPCVLGSSLTTFYPLRSFPYDVISSRLVDHQSFCSRHKSFWLLTQTHF